MAHDEPIPTLERGACIRARCAAFQSALASGQAASLEGALASVPSPWRAAAFADLLAIELAHLKRSGQSPSIDDYHQRFPESRPAIVGVFSSLNRSTETTSVRELQSAAPTVAIPPKKDSRPPVQIPQVRKGNQPTISLETNQPDPSATTPCQPGEATGQRSAHIRTLGRFELTEKLGEGAFGTVYRAHDPQLDRDVALKIPRAGTLDDDPAAQRFLREARAAAQLRHPNIVPIHDAGQIDGTYYIASGFIQGRTLREVMREKSLPPPLAGEACDERGRTGPGVRGNAFTERETALLISKLATALHYAHSQGIIHRDIKPENIMVDDAGEPHVLDFGLARRSAGEELLTREGTVMGTAAYMSPEQARGESHLADARSDLWSLGVVLYELLIGQRPFAAQNLQSLMLEILQREPTPPRSLKPALSKDLDTICQKCLTKEPSGRYQTCQELSDELQRYLRGEPIAARRISQLERAWRWAKRRPAAALLAVVSLVALSSMALGGVFYAEAAIRHTELAEKHLREREALDDLRRDVQLLLVRGEQALAAGKLQEAQVHVEKSLSLIGDSVEFRRERETAQRLNGLLGQRLAESAERLSAEKLLSDFDAHRDTAIFYGSQLFGLDPTKNQEIAEREALSALRLVALDTEKSTTPLMPKHWADHERSRVRTQCYELLLVLADSLASVAGTGGTPRDMPSAESKRRLQRALRTVDRATAMYGRVTEAARLQRQENAVALGEKSNESEPAASETAADYFLLGKLQLRTAGANPKALDETRKNLEQALRLEPDHFWAQYCLGMHFLRVGRADLAKVHLTSCVTRRDDFPWLYVLRGSAQSSLREFELAEADFRRVLELKPDDEARHVTLVNWGVMEFQRKQPVEAERLLLEALALRPNSYQAYLSLAKIHEGGDRLTDAIAAIDKVIEFAPELAIGYRERARLRIRQPDLAGSAADLEAALSREPAGTRQRADDLTRLGEIRFRQHEPAQALATFDQAVSADGNYAPAHLWRGAVLVELRKYSDAESAFDAYLRKGQPTVEFYMTRGMCRASLGNYSGAIDDYSRAIDLNPTAETYTKRGWLYALRGNPLIGLRDFEKALELEPENVDARCGRGQSFARLGQHEPAVADADAVLAKGPKTLENAYMGASIYAVASTRTVSTKPGGPSPAKLQERYRIKAFDLIVQALSKESPDRRETFWRSVIEVDPQWQLLSQTQEFKKLRSLLTVAPKTSVSSAP